MHISFPIGSGAYFPHREQSLLGPQGAEHIIPTEHIIRIGSGAYYSRRERSLLFPGGLVIRLLKWGLWWDGSYPSVQLQQVPPLLAARKEGKEVVPGHAAALVDNRAPGAVRSVEGSSMEGAVEQQSGARCAL